MLSILVSEKKQHKDIYMSVKENYEIFSFVDEFDKNNFKRTIIN